MTQHAQADGPPPEDRGFFDEARRLHAALGGDAFRLRRLIEAGIGQAKLHHDLRNTLSSALMLAERLATSEDPGVSRSARMIVQALDQGQALLGSAAAFASEAAPRLALSRIALAPLIDGAHQALRARFPQLLIANRVAAGMVAMADEAALAAAFRHLIEAAGLAQAKQVEAEAARESRSLRVRLSDDGHAFRADRRASAFTLCGGGYRHGSTSFGLVMARDIIEAHGGRIALAEGAAATCIDIILPA
ncbi:ATP-binding protein [Acidisoma sp. C75]